jgi:hypothetical protein
MRHHWRAFAFATALAVGYAPADQGPAGATGPCAKIMGPVGPDGQPIGFTCENVGNNALLVWNASQLTGNITIKGNFNTVSYFPGAFSVNGTVTSSGNVAFIGGSISINGSITAASVLLAGLSTSAAEIKTTLLGAPERITSGTTSDVIIGQTGKVQATKGNIVMAGTLVSNSGNLSAKKGSVSATTGTRLDVGWQDVMWLEGTHTSSETHHIQNTGKITAANIKLEARRASNLNSIINTGTLSASQNVTFITGLAGIPNLDGTLKPNTFGIRNKDGTIRAETVTISQYYPAVSGGEPTPRTFNLKTSPADREQLKLDISGGNIFGPSEDNTPANPNAAVSDSFRPTSAGSISTTANVVVPQLAASMTHMNANTRAEPKTVASATSKELVRGDSGNKAAAKPSARVKAKPVLLRGAFFNSKISATLK